MFKVVYKARGMATGWIEQSCVTAAASSIEAAQRVNSILARQCQIGSWFVDWYVESAELVG